MLSCSAVNHSNYQKHLEYRADIDGLRAIAVLSVVGFHLFPNAFSGGFIGVDIFFVLSGYLISSIIFSNLKHNNFSMGDFYERRIRRIFPALAVVLLCSFIVGWYVLFADEFKQLGKHVAGGSIFVSNFILSSETGYFDNAAHTKPLLHLWSLGIEEQFYIFWPLLLVFVWKKNWGFLKIAIFVAFVSFILNIFLISNHRTAAFYSSISRCWEIMVGSILQGISLHKRVFVKRYKNYLSVLGISSLVLGFIFIDSTRVFPGWWALLPTLGTVFVVLAGQDAFLNARLLSNKVCVWFGVISYPLYLWHWPIFSFAGIISDPISLSVKTRICILFLSIGLAWITYRFIEKPIRYRKDLQCFVVVPVVLMIVLFCVGIAASQAVFNPRINFASAKLITSAFGDWEYPQHLNEGKQSAGGVYYLNSNQKATTLLFGDSHMEQYSPRFVQTLENNKGRANSFIFVTRGGCPPIPNIFEDAPIHKACGEIRQYAFDLIKQDNVKTVVVGACWNCYFLEQETKAKMSGENYQYYVEENGKKYYFNDDIGRDMALKNLENFIRSIKKNKEVYLLLDNPSGDNFDPRSFLANSRIGRSDDVRLSKSITVENQQLKLRQLLIDIAKRQNIETLDPYSFLCKELQCRTSTEEGVPIYKDVSHIRPFFVRENAAFLDKVILPINIMPR